MSFNTESIKKLLEPLLEQGKSAMDKLNSLEDDLLDIQLQQVVDRLVMNNTMHKWRKNGLWNTQ